MCHCPTEIEDDEIAPRADLWQSFSAHDLKLHDGLMRGTVQLGSLQQGNVVGFVLPTHQGVDEPCWRGCAQAGVLRRDDDVESLARPNELPGPLQALRGIQKGPVRDAKFVFGLCSGEHRTAFGEKPVGVVGQGVSTTNHALLSAFYAEI